MAIRRRDVFSVALAAVFVGGGTLVMAERAPSPAENGLTVEGLAAYGAAIGTIAGGFWLVFQRFTIAARATTGTVTTAAAAATQVIHADGDTTRLLLANMGDQLSDVADRIGGLEVRLGKVEGSISDVRVAIAKLPCPGDQECP